MNRILMLKKMSESLKKKEKFSFRALYPFLMTNGTHARKLCDK